MLYPTINLYKDFIFLNLKAIYNKNVILNMFIIDVGPLIPQHENNTHLKSKSNLNDKKVDKHFEK